MTFRTFISMLLVIAGAGFFTASFTVEMPRWASASSAGLGLVCFYMLQYVPV